MWYSGKDVPAPGMPRTNAARPPQRTQSQTAIRTRRAGQPLHSATQRLPEPAGQAWQRSSSGRGGSRLGGTRPIAGKSSAANAAALLTLSSSQDSLAGLEAAEAKEMLRIGAWSVRRAPGGPDAGLLYVNVETGRAQKEPPQEVLQELEMDSEEEAQMSDGGHGATAEEAASGSCRASRPGSGKGSRPGSASRRADGSRPGSSGGSQPAASMEHFRFRRILLGNSQDLPLAMARDIQKAITEDASFFDMAKKRYCDAPKGEAPFDFEGLPEELEGDAAALAPGEISGVIGTDVGMQIVLRIC